MCTGSPPLLTVTSERRRRSITEASPGTMTVNVELGRRSRTTSPSMLYAVTVEKMIRPGKTVSHQAWGLW